MIPLNHHYLKQAQFLLGNKTKTQQNILTASVFVKVSFVQLQQMSY